MSAATYISRAPQLTPATAFLELVQPDLVAIEEEAICLVFRVDVPLDTVPLAIEVKVIAAAAAELVARAGLGLHVVEELMRVAVARVLLDGVHHAYLEIDAVVR